MQIIEDESRVENHIHNENGKTVKGSQKSKRKSSKSP